MDLTAEQWRLVEPYLPKLVRRADGRGRPWCDNRAVLNGILWVLRTGARWRDLPPRYPSYQTCHRRFQQWARSGVLERILRLLLEHLRQHGQLDLSECFIDATFVPAKKGVVPLAIPVRAKGQKLWPWLTVMVFQSPVTQAVLNHRKLPLSSPYLSIDFYQD